MGCRKKLIKPALRKVYAGEIVEKFGISLRRACRLIGISRKSARYKSVKGNGDEKLKERLFEFVLRWKRFGYRRLHALLIRERYPVNHKKVYRSYKEAGLSLRKRKKKRQFLLKLLRLCHS